MAPNITQQVNKLPLTPGVYLFKDKKNHILYIGKAGKLRVRVRSYFKRPLLDSRLEQMVEKIARIDHILCESEIEALILESELIRRYKPKYNVDWKDDKNFLYIKVTREDFPQVLEARPPLIEKATYLGPFTDAGAVKNTLNILRKIFPYRSCGRLSQKACLQYYIKRCGAPCIGIQDKKEYQKNIKDLVKVLSGKRGRVIKEIEKEMKESAKKHEFEKAVVLRDRIFNLKKINQTLISKEISQDRSRSDEALTGLFTVLKLPRIPRRIEAYDISNISGKQATGSMIVFEDGVPQRKEYKRFRIRTVSGIDDYKMIKEVLARRLKQSWILPDLMIIDGGKGQLGVALDILKKIGLERSIPAIGLAKREEEIVIQDNRGYKLIKLSKESKVLHLLQRIRDEAHRFAITYHEKLRVSEARKSVLDGIPGIGPETRKILLKNFGSVKNIKKVNIEELSKVIGKKKAGLITQQFGNKK